MSQELVINDVKDLKLVLANQYQKQIENYFGDPKKAMKFLSSVVASVQRNPKLLECKPASVINSFMVMAQLELMPSDVTGEAYVLPYKGVAQFQLGYQGLVTLFYRAGAKSITAEIVRAKDDFKMVNGEIFHSPDVFAEDRGEPIGAYVIVELQMGGKIHKAMKKSEIMAIGQKFSQSFKSTFSPWDPANDPELWMWKKTVLKQAAKLVPKNETIFKAIAEDNKDSNIEERKSRFADLPTPPGKGPKTAETEEPAPEAPEATKTAVEEEQQAKDAIVEENTPTRKLKKDAIPTIGEDGKETYQESDYEDDGAKPAEPVKGPAKDKVVGKFKEQQ